MRSRLRLVVTALVGLGLAFAFVAGSAPQPADLHESADAHLFDPGSIITDDLFFNGSAMNAGEVQAFLDAKGVTCKPGTDGTPCLKNYRQDTTDRAGDEYCGPYAGRPDESAAEIITRVGQACGISQRVLLVTLQKEQSLVATSGGSALYARRYREAMGYACPDNGTCDPRYNGFANQVYSSARRFQVYAKNPTSYAHRPGMTVQIRYFPEGVEPGAFNYQSRDCGKVSVYIRNQATAGLYNYTPYVPNRAALDAGYAPAKDPCSTYGNRNFFLYFTDWFGSTQSGDASINDKHASLRASGVDLGGATSAVVCDLPNGGCWRSYQYGSIFWSRYTGAHVVRGAILERFLALGGVRHLGYPTGDDTVAPVNHGYFTDFQSGAIYWSQATGAREVRGNLLDAWRAKGAQAGVLGYPVGGDEAVPGGFRSRFQGGTLYWSAPTGARMVRGALLTRYEAAGGPGVLGFPVADERATVRSGAAVDLTGGAVYWTSATGARVVRGDILATWRQWGAESGPLGYPTGDDQGYSSGFRTTFQGGHVYWSAPTGAHVLRGAILDRYLAHGGAQVLGFPTTDDVAAAGGGARADLQGGAVYWSSATGAHVVRGNILAKWRQWGAESGALGYPTGDDAAAPNGGYLTTFRGGTVYWSSPTGAKVLRGAILQRYVAAGGPAALGYPTTDDGPAANGGARADLQGGAVYWSSATGARVVRGDVLAKWRQLGAESGLLGYPTADEAAVADGTVTTFRGGSLYWSPATGARMVRGALLERYVAAGGPAALGFPTADDGPEGSGAKVPFTGGAAYWSAANGAHVVEGEAARHYREMGESTSFLGFPVADTVETPEGTRTEFERGVIEVTNGQVASAHRR